MADYMDDFEMPDSDQAKADSRLHVRFTLEARPDNAKIEADGGMHYRNIEFIMIRIPGDKTLTVYRPVQPYDKIRFRDKYESFKKNADAPQLGTPLATWPLIPPSQVQELAYINCVTVEQLAGMSDTGTQAMIGLIALRQKAQRFLEAQSGQAGANKLAAELEQRDNAIAALQAQVNELAARAEKASKGK
jgi:hypothetical protein